MNPARVALIDQLHAAARPTALYLTGGGTGLIGELLAVPGASRTVVDARVPYAPAALDELLQTRVEQACSDRTARRLALAAWDNARRYAHDDVTRRDAAIGLGLSAALVSDRPKRGAHRIHVALQTATLTRTWQVELTKGVRSRAAEEQIAADAALALLIAETGGSFTGPQLTVDEVPQVTECVAPHGWRAVLTGEAPLCDVAGRRTWNAADASTTGLTILSGSFDPPHAAHRRMAEIAAARTGRAVHWELPLRNADKPGLDYLEIRRRLQLLGADQQVLLSGLPTFVQKARLFPGATFALGADTLARLIEPRFYGHDPAVMSAAWETLAVAQCRFLVFARVDAAGVVQTIETLGLPAIVARLCEQVPVEEFIDAVSSTTLRAQSSL